MKPFISWAGGKRQLLPELREYMPLSFDTYYEPFIGGGAFLLSELPTNAVINDFNTELVAAWKSLRDNPAELAELLDIHQANNCKDYYLDIRLADRDGRLEQMSIVERGARFIYMNHAGFNGLWRVNKANQNNVPYGRKSTFPKLVTDDFFKISDYLKNHVKIMNGGYMDALETVQIDDFVYLDPPYVPLTATASFTQYTTSEFGYDEQVALRDKAIELHDKGAYVMISNSDNDIVRDLYKDSSIFKIHTVLASRNINRDASKRGQVKEVIVTTY